MSEPSLSLVMLDPGHGGRDRAGRSSPIGVCGPSGTVEKDVTLALARAVARHLGGGAHLTREADVNLSLGERIGRARNAGADVFVSLHCGAPGRAARAWSHVRASAPSRALAESISRQLAAWGGPGSGAETAELAVLAPDHHAPKTAACLVEVDDLADPHGEARLRDHRAVEEIGRAIATGIRQFRGRWGGAQGIPNLNFGPPGPDGRPLGAVTWNWTPVTGSPVLITWREFNDSDTDAASFSDSIIIKSTTGQQIFSELRRRDELRAGTWLDDSVIFTPPGPGRYIAQVRLNDGQMPIPESTTDDNSSESSAIAGSGTHEPTMPTRIPLSNEGYGQRIVGYGASIDDPGLREAIESELRAQLDAERICDNLLRTAAGLSFPEAPSDNNYAGAARVAEPRALQSNDPPPPRPGTPIDLVRAIFLFPPVNLTLRRQSDDAVRRLRSLSTGEQATLITWTTPFAAGILYGVLREPRLWPGAQSVLNEGLNLGLHQFTPDLNLHLDLISPNKSVTLTFDLAPTLRRAGLPF